MWNKETDAINNMGYWNHLKIIKKNTAQHNVKWGSHGTTENSHVGHCAHTEDSTRYKTFNMENNTTLQ
jgi:hypothetical protein